MKRIEINAYAKINLCLDVKGKLDNGFHEVAMVMQQTGLCDRIEVIWENAEDITIDLSCDRPDIPTGRENLAFKAAEEMVASYGNERRGKIAINIKKNIPMAAGLAGGSSDCAAVIHGINRIWDLGLDVISLCRIGAKLGSDVPFCIMGQAAADSALKDHFKKDPGKGHCAVATGRGTDLRPIEGLRSWLVLSRPDVEVSTKEVYRGIDDIEIKERPDIDEMAEALAKDDRTLIRKNMINVLEKFTLKRYPVVVYTKNKIQNMSKNPPLMSGSGPTVFCICDTEEEAAKICRSMKKINEDTFFTKTTF